MPKYFKILSVTLLLTSSLMMAEPVQNATASLLDDALTCEKKWDFQCAIEKYESVLSKQPNSFAALVGLARSHYWVSGGAGRRALPYFERALQINPDDIDCNFHAGMLTKDPKRAIQYLERVRLLNPRHDRVYIHLGLALKEQGRLDEAVAVWKIPIEQGKQAITEKGRIAEVYEQQGKLEDALSLFQEVQEKRPKNKVNQVNIARVLYKLGRYDEALASLNEEGLVNQSEVDLVTAKIYLATGKSEEAQTRLRSACYAGETEACSLGKIPALKPVNGAVNYEGCSLPVPPQFTQIHIWKTSRGHTFLSTSVPETNFPKAIQRIRQLRSFYASKPLCGVVASEQDDHIKKDDASPSYVIMKGKSEQQSVELTLTWDPLFETVSIWLDIGK